MVVYQKMQYFPKYRPEVGENGLFFFKEKSPYIYTYNDLQIGTQNNSNKGTIERVI